MTHDNTNKSRDLKKAVQKFNKSYETFYNKGTVYSMERSEVESLIQQVIRASEKIDKMIAIYGTNKHWLQ